MIRTLLTTTALSVMLTAGVFAQDAVKPVPAPTAVDNTVDAVNNAADAAANAVKDAANATGNAVKDAAASANDTLAKRQPWEISAGYVAVDTDNLVSHLVGKPIFSSDGDDAENIGNVSDLVFDNHGQIVAVVVGVGGFLGIGEKSVAVDFNALKFTLAADNTERWVVPTTSEALTAAPDFVWKDDKPVPAK